MPPSSERLHTLQAGLILNLGTTSLQPRGDEVFIHRPRNPLLLALCEQEWKVETSFLEPH